MTTASDIYLTTESELTSLRSSFRNLLDKAGVSASTSYTFPDGVITALNNIPTIKVDSSYGDIVGYSASISEITLMNDSNVTFISYPTASNIQNDALVSCPKLKKLILNYTGASEGQSISARVDIGLRACKGLTNLISVSIAAGKAINEEAFQGCSALYEALIPTCTKIYARAFQSCRALSRFDAPNAEEVWENAFDGCTSLSQVTLTNCKSVYAAAFQSCSNLETISLPSCISLGGSFTTQQSSIFAGCTKLSSVYIPLVTSIYQNTFSGCENLSTISLPECNYIASSAFLNCTNLKSVYLPTTKSVYLADLNAFTNTPMDVNGSGKFYVPAQESIWSFYLSAGNTWRRLIDAGQFISVPVSN